MRPATARRWLAGITAVAALGVLAWLLLGRSTAPEVTLVTDRAPLQEPVLEVRVADADPGAVVVAMEQGGGRPLTAAVVLRDSDDRASLPLNDAGRELLRGCATHAIELWSARPGGTPSHAADATIRPGAVRCGPLRWAPPALTAPQTITVAQGDSSLHLGPGDYEIRLPPQRKVGGLTIDGGRNVVVRGGWITTAPGGPGRRAIYVKGATGTVHLEGLLIDASAGGESDAIAISAPQAIVQVENVRAVGLRGGKATWHADAIQPWGGVRALRVDRLTASSHYQGLQIPRDQGPIGSVAVSDADLRALPALDGHGGHMLWVSLPGTCASAPISLDGVYVTPRAGRRLGDSVWPQSNDAGCPARVTAGAAGWPSLPVRGSVRMGPPPGGEFVPWGIPGPGYRSPGYR